MYCYFCGQGIRLPYLEENKCEPFGELVDEKSIEIEAKYCPICR